MLRACLFVWLCWVFLLVLARKCYVFCIVFFLDPVYGWYNDICIVFIGYI